MGQFDGQPSVCWSLRGLTEEGDEAWLIRGIARKLYHCPGCHGDIEVGDEHTVVQFVRRLGGTDHHHWHRRCAEEILIAELGRLGGSPLRSRASSGSRAPRARPVRASPNAAGMASCVGAFYARILRVTDQWAPTLLLLAMIVFLPLGLLSALAAEVDINTAEPAGAIEIAALLGAIDTGRDQPARRGLLQRRDRDRPHLTREHERPPKLAEIAAASATGA